MHRIINYVFIICFNLLIAFFYELDSQYIVLFSIACVLLFSSEFLKPAKLYFFISISYILLCFFKPHAFLFLPIASYAHANTIGKFIDTNILNPVVKFTPILYLPLLFTQWNSQTELSYFHFYILICLCILSYLLEYHVYTYNHLNEKYIQSSDATREKNLLLKSKNEALIVKQDYEISLATMHERNRIARDIHDNVGHLLTRALLITGAVKTINQNKDLKPNIDSLDLSLNKAMTAIRSSVHDLHSHTFNLKDAIQAIVNDYTFCNVSFIYKASQEIPSEICYSFIAITKEALTNAAKHSNATMINIQMQEHPGLYQLIFEDNGTKLTGTLTDGIGLENMQERVTLLRGNFHVRNVQGFRIFITIPKKRSELYESDSN